MCYKIPMNILILEDEELAARQTVLDGMTRIIISPPGAYTETTATPAEARAAVQARLAQWRQAYPRYHHWQSWTHAESAAYETLRD